MVLASAGADGNVKLWSTDRDPREKPSWDCFATINHADYLDDARQPRNGDDEEEPAPQVYALQFINQWQGAMASPDSPVGSGTHGLLMTSSDDNIHFWEEIETSTNKSDCKEPDQEVDITDTITKGSSISEFMTIHFTAIERGFGGVFVRRIATSNFPVHKHQNGDKVDDDSEEEEEPSKSRFGGDRNPENIRYVFDASHCMANQLIGVALSDGSLRLVNSQGICVSILQLPGVESHLTSFSWDRTGTRLASCVATGHLILWDIDIRSQVNPSCVAVLEGGELEPFSRPR
jgi:WD40 repeat protein